jgi:mono/diheme cytochrome c family protein
MTLRMVLRLGAAAAFAVVAGGAWAQEPDLGRAEFLSSCAPCHGRDGKGEGPMAHALKQRPADLTVLARNNNGVFPFDRVYRVIDGREEISGHGSRDMPIWGYRFVPPSNKNLKLTDDYLLAPPASAETIVHGRILAVIDYLNRIQAK